MSNEQNLFESVIAALETRRAQVNAEIDADIAKLLEIGERISGVLALSSLATLSTPAKIEKDTFYNMTLPDAARKFLSMNQKPQATNMIIDALEQGGLKRTTYASMYASLSRRENNVGDIVNVNGDWGLPEWYGAKPKKKPEESLPSAAMEEQEEAAEEEAASPEGKTA